MQKTKNKIYILVFIFLLFSILLLVFSLIFRSSVILSKKEIPMSLTIGNKTGFNVSKEAISFGTLSNGTSATRDDISIINNYNFEISLEISVEGDIKNFVIYDPIVYLNPKESKNLTFSTITITNESYGFYNGKAVIVFKRITSK
jgi:hypothetical protein